MNNPPEDHNHLEINGFDLKDLKKNFSALAEELEGGGNNLDQLVQAADNRKGSAEKVPYYRGYNPTIKDFLARANTRDECVEIIEYCLKKGEIDQNEADNYLDRLQKGGPRAFGTRKPGHYDRKL